MNLIDLPSLPAQTQVHGAGASQDSLRDNARIAAGAPAEGGC
jgi:hypothetical protein